MWILINGSVVRWVVNAPSPWMEGYLARGRVIVGVMRGERRQDPRVGLSAHAAMVARSKVAP